MLGAGSGVDSSATTSAESGAGPGVRDMHRSFIVGSNGLMTILLMRTCSGVSAWAK